MRDQSSEWEIKVCDDLGEADLQLVSHFFNEYFPGVFFPECSPRIFQWKLGSGNPAGRGFLTVALHEGKVIGTTSATRQRVLNSRGMITAVEIGDTFTHPDFRRKGHCKVLYPGTVSSDDYLNKSIFGRLVTETLDRARASGVNYVFGTPNENSRPPYIKKLGFREIGWGKVRPWGSPTQRFKIGSRKSLVISIAINLLKVWQKMNLLLSGRNIEIKEGGFESLALDLEAVPPHTLQDRLETVSIRMNQDVAFFRYRYASHPNYRYKYFRIKVRNRTVGWIICVALVRQSGRETLVVSDWIFLDRSLERNLPKYVAILSSTFKTVQLVSLWAVGNNGSALNWARFGFFGREKVSVITKTLGLGVDQDIEDFADFRIGWSDNG